jgi:hypothetical protein
MSARSKESTKCWTNIVSTLLLLGICSLNVLLAHSIAVNTRHRSYGYYKPGHTNPHCIRLVIWRKWENLTFCPSTHSQSVLIKEFSFDRITTDFMIQFSLTDTFCISCHAQSAPDHFRDSNQSRYRGKLEDLTGTSNTLLWSRYFHNWDHH